MKKETKQKKTVKADNVHICRVTKDAKTPMQILQERRDRGAGVRKLFEGKSPFSGEVVKIRRKYYRVAMLFALEDCEKVREVKRRVQKVKQETAAALVDFFGDAGEQLEMAL